jgi:hypothetical protein
MLMYFFAGFFSNLTLCMTKLRVPVLSFPDFTDTLISCKFYMKLDISLILCIFLDLPNVATTMYKIMGKFWLDLQCLPSSFATTCNCFGVDGMLKMGQL